MSTCLAALLRGKIALASHSLSHTHSTHTQTNDRHSLLDACHGGTLRTLPTVLEAVRCRASCWFTTAHLGLAEAREHHHPWSRAGEPQRMRRLPAACSAAQSNRERASVACVHTSSCLHASSCLHVSPCSLPWPCSTCFSRHSGLRSGLQLRTRG